MFDFAPAREDYGLRQRAGMRRAKLEGRRIGRAPLEVDRSAIVRDREGGMSLSKIAKAHRISKASVCRVLNARKPPVSERSLPAA